MNQIFSAQRFWLLLKLDFSEKGRNYLLIALLLSVLLLAMLLPIVLINEFNNILLLSHALALFMVVVFGGSLYTSSAFDQYASPDTGIAALMVPASRVEKYLSALLFCLIFMVPFTLFFIKYHYWSVEYANSRLPKEGYRYNEIPKDIMQYFISIHIVVQGAVLLGSIYFRKLSYVTTVAFLFVVALLACGITLAQALKSTAFPSKLVTFPFSAWKIWYFDLGVSFYIDYPETMQKLVYTFPFAFLLGMWIITFVRLREKEI